jgi:hypothetical protein
MGGLSMPEDGAQFGPVDIGPPENLTGGQMIFADALIHNSSLNGVLRLAFVQNYATPLNMENAGWHAKHVLSLAMPVTALPDMVASLQKMLNDLRTNGWLPQDVE